MSATLEKNRIEHMRPIRYMQFSLQLLVSLVLVIALGLGWWTDRQRLLARVETERNANNAYFIEQTSLNIEEIERYRNVLKSIRIVGGERGTDVHRLVLNGLGVDVEPVVARVIEPDLRDEHVKQIADFQSLRTLHLSSPTLTFDCLRHLAKLPNLTTLTIGGSWLNDAVADHLEENTIVTKLAIWNTSALSDAGLKKILKKFPKVTSLELQSIGSETISQMAGMNELDELLLSNAALSDKMCPEFASLELNRLRLAGLTLAEGALLHVARINGLERLEIVNVPVSNNELQQLAHAPNLKTLFLSNTRMTSFDSLQQQLPNCKIEVPQSGRPIDQAHALNTYNAGGGD